MCIFVCSAYSRWADEVMAKGPTQFDLLWFMPSAFALWVGVIHIKLWTRVQLQLNKLELDKEFFVSTVIMTGLMIGNLTYTKTKVPEPLAFALRVVRRRAVRDEGSLAFISSLDLQNLPSTQSLHHEHTLCFPQNSLTSLAVIKKFICIWQHSLLRIYTASCSSICQP